MAPLPSHISAVAANVACARLFVSGDPSNNGHGSGASDEDQRKHRVAATRALSPVTSRHEPRSPRPPPPAFTVSTSADAGGIGPT